VILEGVRRRRSRQTTSFLDIRQRGDCHRTGRKNQVSPWGKVLQYLGGLLCDERMKALRVSRRQKKLRRKIRSENRLAYLLREHKKANISGSKRGGRILAGSTLDDGLPVLSS